MKYILRNQNLQQDNICYLSLSLCGLKTAIFSEIHTGCKTTAPEVSYSTITVTSAGICC